MRYTDEVRIRFKGSKDLAAQFIPLGRTLLGGVLRRGGELGSLSQSLIRKTFPGGLHIEAGYVGNLPYINIDVSQLDEEAVDRSFLLKLAWEPEGIVLTPSTGREDDEDYLEWGLPSRRADTTGQKLSAEVDEEGAPINPLGLTENGSMPQVILNKYPNNKYLDRVEFVSGLPDTVAVLEGPNPQLRTEIASPQEGGPVRYAYGLKLSEPYSYAYQPDYYEGVEYWNIEVGDINVPGVYEVLREGDTTYTRQLARQFTRDFTSLIYEEPADEWFTHRPEEVLYAGAVAESIFQETNGYRAAVGEEPVYRMVRGDTNAAPLIGRQTARPPGHFFHSHPDFQPGYRTTSGRVFSTTGREPFMSLGHNFRENILLLSPDGIPEWATTPTLVGQFIAESWRDSAEHYPNMVDSLWSEFALPFATWGGGTKLASHHIGAGGGLNAYVDRNDATLPADQFNPVPLIGINNHECWAQLFCARESWVPIYDDLHEGAHGATGVGNGTNPYSHSHFPDARWVGWGRHQYEIPSGLIQAIVPTDVETDDFLGCVGSAMIEQQVEVERDGEIVFDTEKWVRCVYYTSTALIDARAGGGTYPQESDYVRMFVVKFPVRITESSEIPWRPDDADDGRWEIEYEWEWLLEDDWLTNPPAKVWFNSTGDRFTFTMHKISDTYNEALDYLAQFWSEHTYTDTGLGTPVTRDADISALENPRAAVNCHHFEWDDSLVGTDAPMTEYVPTPLVAEITCWTSDPDDDPLDSEAPGFWLTFYKRVLNGTYEVFPHYDPNDVLSYVVLQVDEKSNQLGHRLDGPDFGGRYSYCWRYRKMVFPSGKEIVYMQQYMEGLFPTTFLEGERTEDTGQEDDAVWPGSGDASFFCMVHYMDLLREDIIYSKIFTEKEWVYFPSDPPDERRLRVDGDVEYWMDLDPNEGDEFPYGRTIELLYTIPKSLDNPAINTLPKSDTDPEPFRSSLPNSRWIYNMDVSPSTIFHAEPAGAGLIRANTSGMITPDVDDAVGVFATVTPAGAYVRPPYRTFPQETVDVPWGRPPAGDYQVSCFTGYQYHGDSNTNYVGTGKLALSFMNCNIGPQFSKLGEVQAKVVRYEDRIIVRVGINHVNKVGYLPPTYTKAVGSTFAFSEWEYYAPPEDGEVLLWANFDIDEALGIEGVRDVWPMGKVL